MALPVLPPGEVVPRHGQLPLVLGTRGKRDVRTQFAALCYRTGRKGPKILLISSRDTGRWILPKGWPIDGKTPSECAAIEAWEEAGVRGRMRQDAIGIYSYTKELDTGVNLPVVVVVFALRVQELAKEWPEAGERTRKWVSPKKAARMVDEADLAQLLVRFDPA